MNSYELLSSPRKEIIMKNVMAKNAHKNGGKSSNWLKNTTKTKNKNKTNKQKQTRFCARDHYIKMY